MDLATIIGMVAGISVILASMLMGSGLDAFINVPSLLVVGGGTIAVIFMRFTMRQTLTSFKVAFKAFKTKVDNPHDIIKQAVDLASIVRREGLLALERQKVDNPFFAKGLRLCVDGLEPEFVRKVLTEDMDATIERHEMGQKIFKAVGDAAPAMGMIGTLIGLIQLLGNMDDPKKIGPAMAVALLTTLYGALAANLVALPIADKLEMRSNQESLNKALMIDSIAAIQEGRNPRVLSELLTSYLPKSEASAFAEAAG